MINVCIFYISCTFFSLQNWMLSYNIYIYIVIMVTGASFALQIVRSGAVHLNYVVQTYFYDDPTVTA